MEKLKFTTKSNKEYLDSLKNNPLLSGIDVNINNCNMLSLYINDVTNCKKCKGLDSCLNEPKGYSSQIKQENDITNIIKCPCKYYKEKLENDKKASRFKTLYLPQSILNANFDDFRLDTIERQKYYRYINDFALTFKRGSKNKKGLFLSGNFQIGKTYALACAANLFASNNIDTLLIYFPDMLRELKSLLYKPEFETKMNMLKTVDILMLDDLGAESPSAWVRDEILCPIINYRLQEGLPVFFSTNYSIEGLRDFYERIDNSSNAAERVMARIKNLSTFLEFR